MKWVGDLSCVLVEESKDSSVELAHLGRLFRKQFHELVPLSVQRRVVPQAVEDRAETLAHRVGVVDLAVTRFSGRVALEHPGGLLGLQDVVTRGVSHEVSSCGSWTGDRESDAAFYWLRLP